MSIRALSFPTKSFLAWLMLIVVSVVGIQASHTSVTVNFFDFAAAWDGGWYRSIITAGYHSGPFSAQENIAFFPLYPLVVWIVTDLLFTSPAVAGFIVSVVCFFLALHIIYRLVDETYSQKIAQWTVLLLILNPWSFYFSMLYTESLYLLLAVGMFYLIHKGKLWWAAMVAGLATATRAPGIVLSIVVFSAWMLAHKKQLRSLRFYPKTFLYGLLSIWGLLSFMLFLNFNNQDPLAFSTVQQYWPGREGLGIPHELTVLLEHLTLEAINLQYLIVLMWYGAAVVMIVASLILLKHKHYLYGLFVLLSSLIPLSTGSATSMNRYLIVLFPIFILGAMVIQWYSWKIKASVVLCGLVGLLSMIYLITRADMPFIG